MPLFINKFRKAKETAVEPKKTTSVQKAKPTTTTKPSSSSSSPSPHKHVPNHAARNNLAGPPKVLRPEEVQARMEAAARPKVLRPEELQARLAAARKRRASFSESSLVARRAIYQSCEPSRLSTRPKSITGSPRSSTHGKMRNDTSIDTVLRRPQSLHHRQVTQKENYVLPPAGVSLLAPPLMQRSRNHRTSSSRSSFTQKKSPLSTVSYESDWEESSYCGSTSSAVSSTASSTKSSDMSEDTVSAKSNQAAAVSTFLKVPNENQADGSSHIGTIQSPTSNTSEQQSMKRKSRWAIIPRMSVHVAAH